MCLSVLGKQMCIRALKVKSAFLLVLVTMNDNVVKDWCIR